MRFLLPLFALSIAVPAFLSTSPGSLAAGPEVQACLAQAWPAQQIACLGGEAIASDDPEVCLEAELPGVRWPCVAIYADYVGDPSLCGILPASEDVPASVSQDLCRVQLAVTRRDPSLCEGLETPNLADGCFYQLVETGGDPALCERIANPEVKTVCALDPNALQ